MLKPLPLIDLMTPESPTRTSYIPIMPPTRHLFVPHQSKEWLLPYLEGNRRGLKEGNWSWKSGFRWSFLSQFFWHGEPAGVLRLRSLPEEMMFFVSNFWADTTTVNQVTQQLPRQSTTKLSRISFSILGLPRLPRPISSALWMSWAKTLRRRTRISFSAKLARWNHWGTMRQE